MKEIKVNKIILGPFIEMLQQAYNAGADYIDLVAQQKGNQDALGVLIREEYMNYERYEYSLGKEPNDGIRAERLTDDKLNQLLNNSIN